MMYFLAIFLNLFAIYIVLRGERKHYCLLLLTTYNWIEKRDMKIQATFLRRKLLDRETFSYESVFLETEIQVVFLRRKLFDREIFSYESVSLENNGTKTSRFIHKGDIYCSSLKTIIDSFDSFIVEKEKNKKAFNLFLNPFSLSSPTIMPENYALFSFENRKEKNIFKRKTFNNKNTLELLTTILFSQKEKL